MAGVHIWWTLLLGRPQKKAGSKVKKKLVTYCLNKHRSVTGTSYLQLRVSGENGEDLRDQRWVTEAGGLVAWSPKCLSIYLGGAGG